MSARPKNPGTAHLYKVVAERLSAPRPDPPFVPRPVQVLYGGAHLFKATTPARVGELARGAMEAWGADDRAFARAVGADEALAPVLAARVRQKLQRAPLEAMCIDFEDGFGPRSDAEEDAEAVRAAQELARTDTSAAIGIRVKAIGGPTTTRAMRTLELFLETIGRKLPAGFTVTLPKVTDREQVWVLGELLAALEAQHGLPRIGVELMIETPAALVAGGALATPGLLTERVVAVHLGAYDLTAELGVTAGDQRLDHPFCDLARMLLRLSLAGSAVGIADGATTTLPIPPKDGPPEARANAVHEAWARHAANVTRAIDVGIWQGWDLHPAQLPARYGALFAYFLARRDALAERRRAFQEAAQRATRVGQAFDDAATGRGLEAFFARGVACGAFDA